jgi:tRNA modification GTPase
MSDTIFALSTAMGRAGVAIIRVSGPDAAKSLTQFGVKSPLPARVATRAKLLHPDTQELIDDALVLSFPAPHSFTGEDCVEFHVHGSLAVIQTVLDQLSHIPHFRPALAGEFTRRALMNGKMDLAQVEGLADLIDAETEQQRRQALHFMEGKTSAFYENLRTRIIQNLAHLEAYIDFPDEDLPPGVYDSMRKHVSDLAAQIQDRIQNDTHGERIRDGFYIAIVGAPNVGKSSLLNALAGRDIAIVSHHAGTTRDVLEAHLNIGGYSVIIADTAGIREQADEVEREGIRRSFERAGKADLTLVMLDATQAIPPDIAALIQKHALVVINKCDVEGSHNIFLEHHPVRISVKSGQGMDVLISRLGELLGSLIPSHEPSVISRVRHRQALTHALSHLQQFEKEKEIELQCEELRRAAQEIGKVTGKIDIESVLDEIFRSFCIGK